MCVCVCLVEFSIIFRWFFSIVLFGGIVDTLLCIAFNIQCYRNVISTKLYSYFHRLSLATLNACVQYTSSLLLLCWLISSKFYSPENENGPTDIYVHTNVIKLSNRYYFFYLVLFTLKHLKQKCIFFPPDFNVQGYTTDTDYFTIHTQTQTSTQREREREIHIPISLGVKSQNDIVIVCVHSQHNIA